LVDAISGDIKLSAPVRSVESANGVPAEARSPCRMRTLGYLLSLRRMTAPAAQAAPPIGGPSHISIGGIIHYCNKASPVCRPGVIDRASLCYEARQCVMLRGARPDASSAFLSATSGTPGLPGRASTAQVINVL
jgi:hypothetical protein